MDLSFAVFQEPRGVMRILHLIFSISAFAVVSEFAGKINFNCADMESKEIVYDYPFEFYHNFTVDTSANSTCHRYVTVNGNFSSDAKFFVATGVLAMLYSLIIIFVYAKYDNLYKTNNQIPLGDFIITVIYAVLWLSSSAAWANGLSGLKHATDPNFIEWSGTKLPDCARCPTTTSTFSSLNISIVLGFLNFFIWASDLWFLYKETAWFQGNQGVTTSGV